MKVEACIARRRNYQCHQNTHVILIYQLVRANAGNYVQLTNIASTVHGYSTQPIVYGSNTHIRYQTFLVEICHLVLKISECFWKNMWMSSDHNRSGMSIFLGILIKLTTI